MAKNVKSLITPDHNSKLTSKLLGGFIKAKRTQLGISTEDAALMCNVAKDTLSKIETARGTVQLESVFQICDMLGIELAVRPWDKESL